jgi:ribose transport system substrate-binding protein
MFTAVSNGAGAAAKKETPLQKANAALKKYEGATILPKPGPKFNASSAANDGPVVVASYLSENPAIGEANGGFVAAMTHEGITPNVLDGLGSPTQDNTNIALGVSEGAAAILAQGSDPSSFQSTLSTANQAKIPVIEGMDTDPATTKLYSGITANAGPPWALVGDLMADYVVSSNNGKGHINVFYLDTPDVTGSLQELAAFKRTLKSLSPSAKIEEAGCTAASWATCVEPATLSALQANPGVNYVVPSFDPMIPYSDAAITQLNAKVRVVTSGGTEPFMADLQKGTGVNCEVGIDYPALGLLEADQALRAIVGAKQVKAYEAPIKVFTKANIAGLNLTASTAPASYYVANPATLNNAFYASWK